MRKAAIIIAAAATLLASGCVTRNVQQLPAVTLHCQVIDHTTRRPIAGAWVSIVDRPGDTRQETFYYGPFVTDADGNATAIVKGRTVELTGPEFYYRSADVDAHGYSTRTFDLDTPSLREVIRTGGTVTFDLFPARLPNRRLRMPPKTITMTGW